MVPGWPAHQMQFPSALNLGYSLNELPGWPALRRRRHRAELEHPMCKNSPRCLVSQHRKKRESKNFFAAACNRNPVSPKRAK
eukprot:4412562-Amphidinium_carterae.1